LTHSNVGVDVLVAGGGPAGIATACTLTRMGARVLVVDAGRRRAGLRGQSLPPAVRRPLAALGLDAALDRATQVPSGGVRGSWGPSPIERSFLFDPYGDGWQVDRRHFDERLRLLASAAGINVTPNATLTPPRRVGAVWRVGVRVDGQPRDDVEAAWLVDATGRAAWLARQLGSRPRHHDRVVAVVGVGRPRLPVAPVTLIETVEDGWWYGLSRPDGRAVAAIVTDADLCVRARLRAPAVWLARLRDTSQVGPAFVGLTLDAPPTVEPAGNVLLDRPWGNGWLAVGDAAAAHDPLAGDGVVRALDSGISAAAALANAATGDARALPVHAVTVAGSFAAHLRRSLAFHARERRWPAEPFWARRAP
jgi:flavin-dependent dehydrogenase